MRKNKIVISLIILSLAFSNNLVFADSDSLKLESDLYTDIYKAINEDMKSTITLNGNIDIATIKDVVNKAIIQSENIYGVKNFTTSISNSEVVINLNYSLDKNSAEIQKKIVESKAKEISKVIIKQNFSDLEKAESIFNYLASNIKYKNTGRPEDSSAYGALIDKTALCVGYAKAFKLIGKEAGLDVLIVTSDSNQSAGHAWNKVNINGRWLNFDASGGALNSEIKMVYSGLTDKGFFQLEKITANQNWLLDSEKTLYLTPNDKGISKESWLSRKNRIAKSKNDITKLSFDGMLFYYKLEGGETTKTAMNYMLKSQQTKSKLRSGYAASIQSYNLGENEFIFKLSFENKK